MRFTNPAETYPLNSHYETFLLGQGREALPSVINKAPAVNFEVVRITNRVEPRLLYGRRI